MDLSGNGLSDESASQVLEQLQRIDLRVERLRLAGNGIEAKGLAKVTEYVWNCPDALLELDVSANQVDADPNLGPTPGSDAVSALLRCLYNHASYPQIVTGQNGVTQVLPLTLHLGNNRVKEPARLLKGIEAKGGKKHVKIRPSPEPYDHVGKEYLSVCLPNFLVQGQAVPEPREHKRRKRSRSGKGAPRVRLTPAADAKGADKPKKSRRATLAPAKSEEPEHWRPGSPPRSSSDDANEQAASRRASNPKKSRRQAAARSSSGSPGAQAPPASAPTKGTAKKALVLTDKQQEALQLEVGAKLASFRGLPSEESTRDMLSEFVVCMAVAGKGSEEIQGELNAFLAEEAPTFVKWFTAHIKQWKRSSK